MVRCKRCAFEIDEEPLPQRCPQCGQALAEELQAADRAAGRSTPDTSPTTNPGRLRLGPHARAGPAPVQRARDLPSPVVDERSAKEIARSAKQGVELSEFSEFSKPSKPSEFSKPAKPSKPSKPSEFSKPSKPAESSAGPEEHVRSPARDPGGTHEFIVQETECDGSGVLDLPQPRKLGESTPILVRARRASSACSQRSSTTDAERSSSRRLLVGLVAVGLITVGLIAVGLAAHFWAEASGEEGPVLSPTADALGSIESRLSEDARLIARRDRE